MGSFRSPGEFLRWLHASAYALTRYEFPGRRIIDALIKSMRAKLRQLDKMIAAENEGIKRMQTA